MATSATATQPTLEDVAKIQSRMFRSLLLRFAGPGEGSSSDAELLYLVHVARRSGARLIGEIGFNAGFSSSAFLHWVPGASVVSFDLGEHRSVRAAKKLIDKRFPGRHTLIRGDSRETVPAFAGHNPDLRFDLVFIDGGHDYEVAHADVMSMRRLSTAKTAVIMDDLVPWRSYGAGPTKAWDEAVRDGVIRQDEFFQDGEPVEVAEAPGDRAWASGRYVF